MTVESIVYPLAALLAISALTEAVVEIIKTVVPRPFTENGKRILALIVSISLAFVLNVTIFAMSGAGYYFGAVLAGMIASRGANYIHTLSKVFEGLVIVKK